MCPSICRWVGGSRSPGVRHKSVAGMESLKLISPLHAGAKPEAVGKSGVRLGKRIEERKQYDETGTWWPGVLDAGQPRFGIGEGLAPPES